MKMNRVAMTVFTITFLIGSFYYFFNSGEFEDKKYYAYLQSLESIHRLDNITHFPQNLSQQGNMKLNVLGLVSLDENNQITWIILNHISSKREVLMIPETKKVVLTCQYLNNITKNTSINREVLIFLKGNCS